MHEGITSATILGVTSSFVQARSAGNTCYRIRDWKLTKPSGNSSGKSDISVNGCGSTRSTITQGKKH